MSDEECCGSCGSLSLNDCFGIGYCEKKKDVVTCDDYCGHWEPLKEICLNCGQKVEGKSVERCLVHEGSTFCSKCVCFECQREDDEAAKCGPDGCKL